MKKTYLHLVWLSPPPNYFVNWLLKLSALIVFFILYFIIFHTKHSSAWIKASLKNKQQLKCSHFVAQIETLCTIFNRLVNTPPSALYILNTKCVGCDTHKNIWHVCVQTQKLEQWTTNTGWDFSFWKGVILFILLRVYRGQLKIKFLLFETLKSNRTFSIFDVTNIKE